MTKAKLRKIPPMPYEFWTNILAYKMKSWFKIYEAKHQDAIKVSVYLLLSRYHIITFICLRRFVIKYYTDLVTIVTSSIKLFSCTYRIVHRSDKICDRRFVGSRDHRGGTRILACFSRCSSAERQRF